MSDFPLAYHITLGTYGTRLHGDERGTVDKRLNKPGDPVIGRNDLWKQHETHLLSFPPILFNKTQQLFIQSALPQICKRGGWTHHCSACQNNHIHIMLSTSVDSKTVRRILKRWLGESLSDKYQIPNRQSWWAEGGSIKWVWDNYYLDSVYQYIVNQRAT